MSSAAVVIGALRVNCRKPSHLTGFDALLIDRMVYYNFRVIL